MLDIDAFHLPADVYFAERMLIASRDGVHVHAPVLVPAAIDAICAGLLRAADTLRNMPADRIVAAIDSAARRLGDDAVPRRHVLRSLTAITGYAPAMAAHVLDRMCLDWQAPQLLLLLESEFGGADATRMFVPHAAAGARLRAFAPPLGFHVFSGNVPGVNVTSIVRALLVRSAVLGKSAAAEPVLAPVFARLLSEADPAVGACVAVTCWTGGDEVREAAVMRHASLVVHYGGADAIASLRSRADPQVRFVEHGPRISFAIIDGAAPDHERAQAASDLARAVALFDQQGCVSPQLAYVLGTPADARSFAARVAAAFDRIALELPRGRLDAGDAAAVREFRTRAEFAAIGGGDVELWAGSNMDYSVVYTANPQFEGTCLNRTLLVKPADSIDEVVRRARPFSAFLQTVGIAGLDGGRLAAAAEHLAGIGATRITPIPAMPWPPVTWHHDGRGPLTELVRWVDLEG
ncbi:MAG: acyl-CoA reductase [Gemmatimonadota bacterium]